MWCRPLPIGLFWFPSFLLYFVDEVDKLLMLDSLNFFRTGWIPTRTKNIKKPWKLEKSNINSTKWKFIQKGFDNRYYLTMWMEIIQTNSRKWHKFFGQPIRTLFVYCIDNEIVIVYGRQNLSSHWLGQRHSFLCFIQPSKY